MRKSDELELIKANKEEYIENHTTRQKFEMVFMNLQKGGLNPLIPSVGINSDAWDEKMSSSMFYTTFPIRDQAEKGEWNFKLEPIYFIAILDFPYDEQEEG